MASHTVLEFVHVFFGNEWNAVADPVKITYTPVGAAAPTPLYVVVEEPSGALMTYYFELAANQQVWVSLHENLIYIPKRHINKNPGDTIAP